MTPRLVPFIIAPLAGLMVSTAPAHGASTTPVTPARTGAAATATTPAPPVGVVATITRKDQK